MPGPKLLCPSCGAEVAFQSVASLTAVCAYCRSFLLREDLNLLELGKVAQLQPDGSPIQLYAEGEHEGAKFAVVGRIQMRYPEGFWNEWYLRFLDEDRAGWLGEAQGFYTVTFPAQAKGPLPPYANLAIGQEIALEDGPYRVRGKEEARYVSAEGELPFKSPLGASGRFADLAGGQRRCATIDYSEEAPLLFAGRHVEFDELKLTGLKEIPGW